MEFKILTGPANSGKSQGLCRKIVKQAADAPDESFIVIVPEQFTLQMQRRVAQTAENHAVMNIDVVSFNRLSLKVFSELGINLNEVLDDTAKALVLRHVLEEHAAKLSVFKNMIRTEGFIEEMKSVITELKTYGVSPEDLEAACEGLRAEDPRLFQKLNDIKLIYKCFNEEIKNIYTTSEEVPDLFARVLYFSGSIKNAHIFLDGFTGFTPVQYKIIEGFLSVCKSVTCAITAPASALTGSSRETDLFYLPNETYRRLAEIAEKSGIALQVISCAPLSARRADEDLVNSAAGNRALIFEYEAGNISDEACFAAAKIAELVRTENFRYREIAVVAADMESYYPWLEKAFRKFNIPVFIDYKAKITGNRLARFVSAALRIVKERFSRDSVFSFLKCGLCDFTADEIYRLENYCIEFGIKKTVAWSRPFVKNRTLHGAQTAWDLEEINALRERFMKIISPFAARARRAKTAAEYMDALNVLFEVNNTEEKLADIASRLKEEGDERLAGEYEQIFSVIKELLEKTKVLTKESPVSLEDYIKIIRDGILEIKIGLIPPTLDVVTAGDLERSRLNKIKALFVLGAAQGSLPAAPAGGGLLSERDRKALKGSLSLAPSPSEKYCSQRYYLYLMLNKPKNYLYLCRPAVSADGSSPERSEIFEELDEYIPGAKERLKKADASCMNEYYEEEQGLEILAAQIREYAQGGKSTPVDEELLGHMCAERPADAAKIIESAFYANKESRLDKALSRALYGDVLHGSVSRFESFNECAFRHFLSYGLGLRPREEYEIKASSLGSIYHSALEKYVKSVKGAGFDIRKITDEQSHALASAAAAQAISEEESRVFESSARNLYQAQRTIEVVVKTTDIIRENIKKSRYDIAAAEQHFSSVSDDGDIFSGVIDRIDIYETADDVYVNVIDYKTGSKAFSLSGLIGGTQLQLPVYMETALDIIQAGYPDKSVRPAGMYYFLVRDEFESEEKKGAEDACLKGFAEEETKMRALTEYAAGKLKETGQKIKNGDVSAEPLKEGEKNSVCGYCDYKEICRFKEGSFGAQARQAEHLPKSMAEGEIYGTD